MTRPLTQVTGYGFYQIVFLKLSLRFQISILIMYLQMNYSLISISTPAGSSRDMRASTVFCVGLIMSMSLLCVLRSNCSRLSLYSWTARNGTGNLCVCSLSRLNDFLSRLVDELMVVGFKTDSNHFLCCCHLCFLLIFVR